MESHGGIQQQNKGSQWTGTKPISELPFDQRDYNDDCRGSSYPEQPPLRKKSDTIPLSFQDSSQQDVFYSGNPGTTHETFFDTSVFNIVDHQPSLTTSASLSPTINEQSVPFNDPFLGRPNLFLNHSTSAPTMGIIANIGCNNSSAQCLRRSTESFHTMGHTNSVPSSLLSPVEDGTLISALAESFHLNILNEMAGDQPLERICGDELASDDDLPLRLIQMVQSLLSFIRANGWTIAETIEKGMSAAANTASSAAALFRDSLPFSQQQQQAMEMNGPDSLGPSTIGNKCKQCETTSYLDQFQPTDASCLKCSDREHHTQCGNSIRNSSRGTVGHCDECCYEEAQTRLLSSYQYDLRSTSTGSISESNSHQGSSRHDATAGSIDGEEKRATIAAGLSSQCSSRAQDTLKRQAEAIFNRMMTLMLNTRAGASVSNVALLFWQTFQSALNEMGRLQSTVCLMRSTVLQLTERLEKTTVGLSKVHQELQDVRETKQKVSTVLVRKLL